MNKSNLPDFSVDKFSYELPEDRIAYEPLAQRNQSKLLLFQNGKIAETKFSKLIDYLPHNAALVLNNTKVIPARLHFLSETGAAIELFLLKCINPQDNIWECLVGNKRKFKNGSVLINQFSDDFELTAVWFARENNLVQFHEKGTTSVAEALKKAGKIPLPPYIKRAATASDEIQYQTIFGTEEGAVAAPTASLHFTENQLDELRAKEIPLIQITLHVGMGTFMPVSAPSSAGHVMHKESFTISLNSIKQMVAAPFLIPCGTTSMRTIESLPFIGMKLREHHLNPFEVLSDDPYSERYLHDKGEAMSFLIEFMEKNNLVLISGETSIFILPGFHFHFSKGLITNFHQPNSTLLMLIEAFIGEKWKEIYQYALKNEFRFLSYGDSSLLIP